MLSPCPKSYFQKSDAEILQSNPKNPESSKLSRPPPKNPFAEPHKTIPDPWRQRQSPGSTPNRNPLNLNPEPETPEPPLLPKMNKKAIQTQHLNPKPKTRNPNP